VNRIAQYILKTDLALFSPLYVNAVSQVSFYIAHITITVHRREQRLLVINRGAD